MSRARRKKAFNKGTPKFLRMPARWAKRPRWQPDPVRQLLARVQVNDGKN